MAWSSQTSSATMLWRAGGRASMRVGRARPRETTWGRSRQLMVTGGPPPASPSGRAAGSTARACQRRGEGAATSSRGAGAHQQRREGGGKANGGRTAEESATRWPPVAVGNGDGGGDWSPPRPIPSMGKLGEARRSRWRAQLRAGRPLVAGRSGGRHVARVWARALEEPERGSARERRG
jgi:hypothetical protein